MPKNIGLKPRVTAVNILDKVIRKKITIDSALQQNHDFLNLPGNDRALVYMIVFTSLKYKQVIDLIIGKLITKPLPKKSGQVREILLVGATQILFLRTNDYAVVDTSVTIAGKNHQTIHLKGLVNAVLRNISKHREVLLEQYTNRVLPEWLYKRWQKSYGDSKVSKIIETILVSPYIDITVKSQSEKWLKLLSGHMLPTGNIRVAQAKDITSLPGFTDGQWWVQDIAAAIPAQLLNIKSGQEVLDICAAPGGKTAQLLKYGAKVTAIDISKGRIKTLKENLFRLKYSAEIIAIDARKFMPDKQFSAILLDAPCSATGTIRRNPDIMYLKNAEDIKKLAKVQREILQHAINLLKPGGVLVYCVCSLEIEEGEEQVEYILGNNANIKRDIVQIGELSGLTEVINKNGDIRAMPYDYQQDDKSISGMDGFFISRLRKDI